MNGLGGRRLAPLLAALLAALPARAAGPTAFLPRTIDWGSYLDLFAAYESDDLRTGPRQFTWRDTYFKEKLTLFTDGFFYDPRFIRYRLSVTGGLKQESYVANFVEPLGWRNGSSLEYDARATFLPEHPYNLELFATRYEPLLREQYATQRSSVYTSRGLDARYRRKPWFAHVRLSDDTIDSAESSYGVRKLILDAKYLKEWGNGKKLSFDASSTPSRFTSDAGYRGDTSETTLGASVDLKWLRSTTGATLTSLSQGGGEALSTRTRQRSLFEQASADLARELRLDLSYRYQDDHDEIGGGSEPAERSSTRRSLDVEVHHQLYESLQTILALRSDSGSSGGGSTNALSESLTLNYTKRIPRGRLFLGLSGSVTSVTSEGQTQAVDETHAAVAVPGAFTLDRPSVETTGLVLLVRSPEPPYELVLLVEGAHYTVAVTGGRLEITVTALPTPFVLPGTFEFRASYVVVSGDYRERIRSFGASGSVSLLDNLVTPYASYSSVRSSLLEGSFPGGSLDSDAVTAGVSLYGGPLRGKAEYQDLRWEIGPYTQWRAEAQYIGAIARSTNVNATLGWQHRHYGETAAGGGRPPYSETITSASGSIQQFLFTRAVAAHVGGTWSRISGLSRATYVTLNGGLTWRVAKIDFSAGATYTSSDTRDATPYAGERAHQYYYLKLRRFLF